MEENDKAMYDDSTKTFDFSKIANILEFSKTLKELTYNDEISINGKKYDLYLVISPFKET